MSSSYGIIKHINVEHKSKLSSILISHKLVVDMPCGGNQTCGKCKVKVRGNQSELKDPEVKWLTSEELNECTRLACCVEVLGDVQVELVTPQDDIELIIHERGAVEDYRNSGFGLAVDIGTTSLAVQFIELSTGKIVAQANAYNRQSRFGADVMSRLEYARRDNGLNDLFNCIHDQLHDMINLCKSNTAITTIRESVLTGNTVMLHFYEHLNTETLCVSPFLPTSLFGQYSSYCIDGRSTFLPSCVGSFIGADIVCAIVASKMMETTNSIALLIDLGTNGEIVLKYNDSLHCTSTAAGPAFEGALISCGMRGKEGAIDKVYLESDVLKLSVIGDGKAEGICGSGLVDTLSIMLKLGLMDETGRLAEAKGDERGVKIINGELAWELGETSVYINQRDIRQFQLAKSAICAGILTLIEHVGLSIDAIDVFYLAGGFGHYLNVENAIDLGLLPRGITEKVCVIGNAALSGAAKLLVDDVLKEKCQAIASGANEVALSSNATFSKLFIEGMTFEAQ